MENLMKEKVMKENFTYYHHKNHAGHSTFNFIHSSRSKTIFFHCSNNFNVTEQDHINRHQETKDEQEYDVWRCVVSLWLPVDGTAGRIKNILA